MNKVRKNFLVKKGEIVSFDEKWIYDQVGQEGEVEVRAVVEDGGFFRGKGTIVIAKDVARINAFLSFKVLLLGKTARAEVQPELEIDSNDVKASHSASVGQVDEEQLFYLMSRGISRPEAVRLIVKAFLN
ncbi:SufD family Fe-S cluster assembly protein [Candidatus Shapirobacteria bacterium]|nr:SufD family Fe-S cluster assembly protein [Candidatus Shapirobacteria bacterium]